MWWCFRRPMPFSLTCSMSVLSALVASGQAKANVVDDWNKITVDTIVADNWSAIRGTRGVAIVQAAVFDALDSIDPRFAPYVYKGRAAAGASQVAAASEASFKALASLLPERAQALAAKNDEVLATVTDPAARSAGVAAGDAAAAAILADRANDGFNETVDPPPTPGGPGVYQQTAPGRMFPQHFPEMRPFGIPNSADYRLPPPPPLASSQFMRDLGEVRETGDARKPHTAEHLAIARFHVAAGYIDWNAIARQAAIAAGADLQTTARDLALLNFTLSDSFEASFDSKNTYHFWRPLTAIQAGGGGFGHPEIAPDPDWKSVIPAPLFAEYPCMHCAIGAAAQVVLERLFPAPLKFTVDSGEPVLSYGGEQGRPATPEQSRSYDSFRQFAEEESESRILGGVHFRWSAIAGIAQGRLVAEQELKLLRPTE